MNSLAELSLRPSYHKGEDDIAGVFYLPCMERALIYDRAVGYFNSTIYIIAWPSLKEFVKRGGKMRVICSPVLSSNDKAAIEEGYTARTLTELGVGLASEIEKMVNDDYLGKPARVLASLVSLGVIDFKIAFFDRETKARHKRLFHDKIGVFSDGHGNTVVFKGSMNETWAGLSLDGNLESVDVYVSWEGDRDKKRVEGEQLYFESLWQDRYPTIKVHEFPEVARTAFIKASDAVGWEKLADEISEELALSLTISADKRPGGKIPRPHQTQALMGWYAQNRRGVFEHATGSGKTFTALCAIRDSFARGETPLIFVPSELLLKQWKTEVEVTLSDLSPQILMCGGGHTAWRERRLLRNWTMPGSDPRIVISTLQTAASGEMFLKGLSQGDHLFLVVDEVHRIGSENNLRLLEIESGPRLGLSATPRRAGDPLGTQAIFDYFGNIVDPPFTLQDAINSEALTPYMYYVHQVKLNEQEQADWNSQTDEIRKLFARNRNSKKPQPNWETRFAHMLIERSRIVKNAEGKIELAAEVLRRFYVPGDRWIVYCDSQTQLYRVQRILLENGIDAGEYHSEMRGDRNGTLRHFEIDGGVLVSIRCLDEGIDIPNVSHALILASSKNPREFVQRRGRVLRRAPGKSVAHVHDALVIPGKIGDDEPDNSSILEGELSRAIEFGQAALNPSAITDLKRVALKFGIEYSALTEIGFEDDEEA